MDADELEFMCCGSGVKLLAGLCPRVEMLIDPFQTLLTLPHDKLIGIAEKVGILFLYHRRRLSRSLSRRS